MRLLVEAAEQLDEVGQRHFMTLMTTYDFQGTTRGHVGSGDEFHFSPPSGGGDEAVGGGGGEA